MSENAMFCAGKKCPVGSPIETQEVATIFYEERLLCVIALPTSPNPIFFFFFARLYARIANISFLPKASLNDHSVVLH
jgi:hypothetical protein